MHNTCGINISSHPEYYHKHVSQKLIYKNLHVAVGGVKSPPVKRIPVERIGKILPTTTTRSLQYIIPSKVKERGKTHCNSATLYYKIYHKKLCTYK